MTTTGAGRCPERWLIYAGRAYVIRFAGWDTGYLRFVSRIGSDLAERPLCKFEPQIDVELTARTGRATASCARPSPNSG